MSVRTFAAMSFAAALMLVLAGAAHAAGSSHSGTTFGAHAAATSNGRHALDRDKGLARAEDRRDRHGHHRDHGRKHKVKTGLKLHPAVPPPVNRN